MTEWEGAPERTSTPAPFALSPIPMPRYSGPMAARDMLGNIDRRQLLIGGGVGVGLLVAWAVWPRHYAPNLTAAKGETIYGAWLKIGADGHVTVAVPQAEHGQGVYTTLPQIIADELGADWRTVAVQPAPLNPLYANPMAADVLFEGVFD